LLLEAALGLETCHLIFYDSILLPRVPVPLRQKVTVPTVPVSVQHCRQPLVPE